MNFNAALNAAHNAVTTYANYLVDAGKSEEEYNEKRDELKELLDEEAGENINFNMGFQAVNINANAHNIDEAKANLVSIIQLIRQNPQHIQAAKENIDDVFEEVWEDFMGENDQEGGYSHKGRKSSTRRRHRKGRKSSTRRRHHIKRSRSQKRRSNTHRRRRY